MCSSQWLSQRLFHLDVENWTQQFYGFLYLLQPDSLRGATLSHICWMALAPALPPLPPTTKSMSMPHMSMRFTISRRSAPPRLVPRMVPPCSWMLSTVWLVRTMGLQVVL